jgi:hypothetical protein
MKMPRIFIVVVGGGEVFALATTHCQPAASIKVHLRLTSSHPVITQV